MTVGACALALTFAPTATGLLGNILRSPAVSVLILLAVGGALCYTVVMGVSLWVR